MELSERKEKIIQAVVDNYIERCEPISSSEIQSDYLPALSSATIRNELSALEGMGYLAQPHTSSGRVPTVQAYKLYVEKLMPKAQLTDKDVAVIHKYFDKKVTEIDKLLKNTAKVISEITNLAGIAVKEDVKQAQIQNIKIVKISQRQALVIVVTNMDVFKDAMVDISDDASDEYCDVASNIVTNAFAGHSVEEVLSPQSIVRQVRREYEEIFNKVIEVLRNYSSAQSDDIMLEGGAKLLQQPEFANVERAKAMFEIMEAKEYSDTENAANLDNITIDIKQGESNMPDYAIVSTHMNAGGVNIGKAGVIGPARMDYSKIVSVLSYIGNIVNIYNEEDEE